MEENPLGQVDIVRTTVHNGDIVDMEKNIGIMVATAEAVDLVAFLLVTRICFTFLNSRLNPE